MWRINWEITEEYLKNAWIFSGLKATRDDAENNRRYIVDIYENENILDYIIEPQSKQ
ncbi:MAG: hypothetical protein JRI94_00110 [Deltaproteobacteria bacterium]|nr:hypothetical protein [Deltaproteobacteria bacterium]MBW2031985.1 hypothetical protein [Deltaproteobacteria bacterium]